MALHTSFRCHAVALLVAHILAASLALLARSTIASTSETGGALPLSTSTFAHVDLVPLLSRKDPRR